MFRSNDVVQDLKTVILDLKKELATTREENQLLKVKLRKLQNEVNKRDRQIETLLDPRKSAFVKKVISEEGASMLINLKDQNRKLEKALNEKDLLITRLQNNMRIKRLYTAKLGDKKSNFVDNQTKDLKSLSLCNIGQNRQSYGSRCKGVAARRSVSADRLQEFEKLSSNIQRIRCANSDVKAEPGDFSVPDDMKCDGGSPASDLERDELLCDNPHEEVLHLQNYFMDMIAEVGQLKTTIATLQTKQDKTADMLQKKDNSLVHLAKEVNSLNQQQPRRKGTSAKTKHSNADKKKTNVKSEPSRNGSASNLTGKENEEVEEKSSLCSELELIQQPTDVHDLGGIQRIIVSELNHTPKINAEEERKKTFHSLVEKMMKVT